MTRKQADEEEDGVLETPAKIIIINSEQEPQYLEAVKCKCSLPSVPDDVQELGGLAFVYQNLHDVWDKLASVLFACSVPDSLEKEI